MVWLDSLRLRSRSPRMRRKAIEKLTSDSNLRGLKLLIASLGDHDREVRWAAAQALSTLNEELSVASRLAALTDPPAEGTAGSAPAPAPDKARRLPSTPKPSAPHKPVLSLVAKQTSQPASSETLHNLGHPDSRIRLSAAQTLEPLADPKHLTHFVTLLADENFEIRATAIHYLKRLGEPAVAPVLLQRLADPDSDVRIAAAQALGAIRNPAALETLVVSLTDEEPAVRQAVAVALEQIDPRWIRTDAARLALPRLELLLKDSRPWIAAAAEKVLDKLKSAKDRDTEVWKRESGIRKL